LLARSSQLGAEQQCNIVLAEAQSMANPESPERKKSVIVQLANYSQLAFIFPAATVVGWLIGAALDRWLHTTWLYLVGLILGIVAGFVELIRTVMKSEQKD
jgi:F0F1-type ATP synthase assembly protein I